MIAADLKLAYDRPTFVRELGIEPDPWQQDLLRTSSDRILLTAHASPARASWPH